MSQFTYVINNFIEENGLPLLIAKGVLHSEEDCNSFKENFLGKNKRLIDDLLDYKEEKIEKANSSFDMLQESINQLGMQEAFNQTFCQYLSEEDIEMIQSAIDNGRTSLIELFTSFKANPNCSVLKNVL